MSDVVTNYLACWNETDPTARRALVERHFADTATYVDPLAEAQGHDALDATIAAVQQQFPGFVFSAAGPTDAHHRQTRFGWTLGPAGTRDAEAPIVGFDVVVTDENGRIATVLGFLDRVPG